MTPPKKKAAVRFHGWFQPPKATRAGSGRRRSGDLSSAPECCCRVPSGFPVSVGEGVVESVRLEVWGAVWTLQMGWKFPGVTGWNGFFLGQAKSWKVSGVNFCSSDVRFRDSLFQQWIERAEAKVKLLSWSYFSLVLGGRVNYVKTRCFWASMNLLGLWGSRGHHSWMWCDLQTCSWLKPKLWGCNVHVCMSTTWELRRL